MSYYIAPHPYRFARTMPRSAVRPPDHDYRLAVDVRHEDDTYIIQALTPGLKAEDLNIQILDAVVTISGEYKADENEYLLSELLRGSFSRSLELPVAVDAGKAEARIKDGLLTLRLPKADSARPKTIKVTVK